MKPLPLVEEIRSARAECDEAHVAMGFASQVDAALMSISVLRDQLAYKPDIQVVIPGAALLESVATAFDALAHLTAEQPAADLDFPRRLAVRQGKLEVARSFLKPIANDGQRRAGVLHGLQHDQRHRLEAPQWSQEVTHLGALGQERTELAAALAPVDQQVAMLQPARDVLASWTDRLAEAASAVGSDDRVNAWKAAQMAAGLIRGLGTLVAQANLEIELPPVPDLPARPDEALHADLIASVNQALQQLADLASILDAHHRDVAAEQTRLRTRHDAVIAEIVEHMG